MAQSSVVIPNGIWTWFNQPNAVYDSGDDILYLGAIQYNASGGLPVVISWDFTNQIYKLGRPRTSSLSEIDDHDNPALCILDDGTIFAAYSQHGATAYFNRTASPGDIQDWGTEDDVGSGNSYAQIVQMGDTAKTLYWFFRAGTSYRSFRTSTDYGANWTAAPTAQFVQNTGQRPYLLLYQTSSTRIDFFVSSGQPSETTNSLYHFYMTVAANGDREYFESDGTSIGDDSVLPIELADMTLVWDGATANSWNWDIVDIGGTLAVVFATFESSNTVHRYYQGRWNGSAWQTDEICEGGTTATADYLYATEAQYSGGVCLDPNDINTVYVSREYGSGDFRVEKWTHTGTFPSGTWAKDSDVSGNTGTVNGRPWCVRGLSPTHVFWWEGTYTSYTSFFTRIRSSPSLTWRAAKESSPVWTPANAPTGTKAYYLMHEGTGAPTDLTGSYNTSATGSPTWNSAGGDDFGAYLSGFTTSAYFTMDQLATDFVNVFALGYPWWTALLFKTGSTTTGWGYSLGRSSSNNPVVGIRSGGSLGGFWRDDANAGGAAEESTVSANKTNGEYHVVIHAKTASNSHKVWYDGRLVRNETTNTSTTTVDRASIGVLRRGAVAEPWPGEIHAIVIGWGDAPDFEELTIDLLQGQFSGTWATGGATVVPSIMLLGVGA